MILLFVLTCYSYEKDPSFVPNYFRLPRICIYWFWFALGHLLKSYMHFDFSKKLPKYKAIITTITVLLALLYFLFFFKLDALWYPKFVTFLAISFSVLLTQFEFFNNMFREFGKYSLQLYLLQGFFLTLARTIICKICGVTNPVIIISFNLFWAFFISFLLIKHLLVRFKAIRFVMGIQ